MGEAKRRKTVDQTAHDITKQLGDSGHLIMGGFAAFLLMHKIDPKTADVGPLAMLHEAYMGGAQHLWHSMLSIMDPGREPTAADYKRMDLIEAELSAWRDRKMGELATAMKTKGSS